MDYSAGSKHLKKTTPLAARRGWFTWLVLALVLVISGVTFAEERFPPPQFKKPHENPLVQYVAPRAEVWQYIDVAALAAALAIGAYLTLVRRSRVGVFALTVACVAYFGFYRQGCVCAVGSIQNVAAATFDGAPLPWMVALYFVLPLLAALFFGRVFCAGVCPLGAIQDLVLFKPIQLPGWVEAGFGLFAHAYLGLAVLYAATGSDFVICSWDPFVGFFRRSGSVGMLLIGAGLLISSMFIGRIYCRFICPYSVLLRALARLAQWKVRISPKECIDCKLCETACPFGALARPTPAAGKSHDRDAAQRRILTVVGGCAALLIVLTALGYASRGYLAQVDRTVQLAQRIALEESRKVTGTTDESAAWHKGGEAADELYNRARVIEGKFGVGGALLGAWIALAVSARLIKYALPRKRTEYDADPASCLSCARCFSSCPVEQERLGLVRVTVQGRQPETVAV